MKLLSELLPLVEKTAKSDALTEGAKPSVRVKLKSATYSRVSFTEIRKAIEKRFNVHVGSYSYGDELHVFEGVKALALSSKQNGISVKQMLADSELALDALDDFEEGRIASDDIEYLISLLISAGILTAGNYIVDTDKHDDY